VPTAFAQKDKEEEVMDFGAERLGGQEMHLISPLLVTLLYQLLLQTRFRETTPRLFIPLYIKVSNSFKGTL